MSTDMRGALWRAALFTMVCALGMGGLFMVFAQLRFEPEKAYRADFTNVSGLQEGNFVRIAGVEVGKVKKVTVEPDSTVLVEFTADDAVVLTDGTKAAVRYDDLIGGRYMALEQGPGGVQPLTPGQTIPIDRTEPALDLDALIGGFRPLFRALDPDQVNALSGQLIQAFQGQGDAVNSFLAQTATLTSTLADRDDVIGELIGNLNTVLGTLDNRSDQVAKAVTSLSELVRGLAARKTDISTGMADVNEAARTVGDLLEHARPAFKETVAQTDRAAGIVVADHDYVDHLLNTLPDVYQTLARQGLYGDFFSFYLCNVSLRLNGKGGQPVYVKVVSQATGRCAPK
ncbi:MAG: phospholipid/cholesterol/gamma-HCH transport system substrate-binding protein [Mycobacterium sp.]|nr:phospholipid/cholesterol/gamma-HCH transport system substrate-binding protein [Mycobacterium sp.]